MEVSPVQLATGRGNHTPKSFDQTLLEPFWHIPRQLTY